MPKLTVEQQDNMRALVAALRSGEYFQAFGTLKRDDRCFCVAGVACDVFAKRTDDGWWDYGNYFFMKDGLPSDAEIPKPVIDYYGFDKDDMDRPVLSDIDLYCHNDIRQLPLSDIADLIEKEYLNA